LGVDPVDDTANLGYDDDRLGPELSRDHGLGCIGPRRQIPGHQAPKCERQSERPE
jgi:hypothetical protein